MMHRIKLSNMNKYALVDDEDYPLLKRHNRRRCTNKSSKTYYAATCMANTQIKMHHFIVGKVRTMMVIDHINRNGLDNRKENLRVVTWSENSINKGGMKRRNSSSKYRGVGLDKSYKKRKKWKAYIRKGAKCLHLGLFDNEINAAKAYDKMAKELFGGHCFLNEREFNLK